MLQHNPHFNAVNQAFPHIGIKLQEFWGSRDFVTYMLGLIHGTRDGTRRGFPGDVLFALYALSDEHQQAHPEFLSHAPDDFWAHVEARPQGQ